jgi:hypothetical protein
MDRRTTQRVARDILDALAFDELTRPASPAISSIWQLRDTNRRAMATSATAWFRWG